jgi:crotonobetainyl-CoA:carnitine CoA-transferase CaiB-like acyl-CoA transferase
MKHIEHHKAIHNSIREEAEQSLDEMLAVYVQRKMYKEAREHLEEVKVTFSKYDNWDSILRCAEAEKSFQELGYQVNLMKLMREK